MQKRSDTLLFSATDLANHLGCGHLTHLNHQVAESLLEREYRPDPWRELLAELGDRHEAAYLEHLRDSGKTVVDIAEFGGEASLEKTLEAFREGVDVIAQAQLQLGAWRGRADFLLKVDRASDLGPWSYEVADTKLSQTTRASAVIQLCVYSDLLASIQKLMPSHMLVVKPGADQQLFTIDKLRTADFMAYYRHAKRRFEQFMAAGPPVDSYPEPVSRCEFCNWRSSCNQTWRADDHLTFVAGISKLQRAELEEHSITTLESFAQSPHPLPARRRRGSIESFAKSHRQAQIQLRGRHTGQPEYEFNEVEEGRGFLRLPEPNPGDIFFDIEGNPRAVGEGLEYLLGYTFEADGQSVYRSLWGLSKAEEKRAFEQFMDEAMHRWQQHDGMHIYHFAPYEPSALKRLAARHATRENELDELLRGTRLVDLFAIVRQGIRASVESYSIKKLERFYNYERLKELDEATSALRTIERLTELNLIHELTPQHRSTIETYNKDDCLSTAALRDWLEQLRRELMDTGQELPRPELRDGDASDALQQRGAEVEAQFLRLTSDIAEAPVNDDQRARWLLAHMLDYVRREKKCAWWDYFELRELEPEGALAERKAIYGLQFQGEQPKQRKERNTTHRYHFEPQEVSIEAGDQLHEIMGEIFEDEIGTVRFIDPAAGIIDIKKCGAAIDKHPTGVFEFKDIRAGVLSESLLAFATTVADAHENGAELKSARYALLAKHPPRLNTRTLSSEATSKPFSTSGRRWSAKGGPDEGVKNRTADRAAISPLTREANTNDPKQRATDLALDLNNSVLAIQGPPGSGKTYSGGHMIVALARAGKRVGVTAVSHKVITNLLESVTKHAANGAHVAVSQKTDADLPENIERLAGNPAALEAIDEGKVVGGTAWLWARADAEQKLDYLFVDEAGQMSLAMVLAAGRAANNIVLLGDPQQLEQPQRAAHPEGSEVAALDHLLDGHQTMPPSKGLFFEKTWRLHPRICAFTSEQFYEDRLTSRPGLENQKVFGISAAGLGGVPPTPFSPVGGEGGRRPDEGASGLLFIPVNHTNNQNRSLEEVAAVATIVSELLDGNHHWTDEASKRAPLTAKDILIVAPYNAQVSALRTTLPQCKVGTVDKFQGREAAIAIYSLTSSSVDDAPRGLGFLLSPNRLNVATSRARCLVIVVGSPALLEADCHSVDQLRRANRLCRYRELVSAAECKS